MARGSVDPHTIEADLARDEEYQAPPREEGQSPTSTGDDDAPRRAEDHPSEQQIDINLLESQQQRPGLQIAETIVVAPSEKQEFTVSGPDEETQPGGPRAVPPGESM